MRFKYGVEEVILAQGGDYPATRPYNLPQVQDRTAANTLQIEDLGLDIETREIIFNLMTESDHDALKNFFVNVVRAGAKIFEFEDEYGRIGDVRFINTDWNLQETSYRRWSGALIVEYAQ